MNDSTDIMKDLMSEWHQFLNEASIPIRQKAHIQIPDDLKYIHKIITEKGKKLFLVGGAVRDVLMGKIPKDYDLATDAKPGQVIQILQSREGLRLDLTGRAFGVVRVKTPEGNEYEIATFRRDIGKGRRPAGVEFSDIGTDATRRDLTINALFYDIDSGEILDYVGGIADIKNGIIRAVGNPEERFDEDKLRILRTVRFAGRMGSNLDPETKNAILKDNELVGVAEPRITDEFIKGVESSKNVERFLGLLKELNLFGQIFPGLDIDISGGGSHNYFVQIAALLRNNPIEMIVPVLKKMRYSGAEIKVIKFLLQFSHLSDNTAPRLKKSFNLQRAWGIDPKYLKDLAAITGTPSEIDVQRFIQFAAAPPAANPRELIAQGLKYEEIGRAMEQAEIDSYRQLSIESISRMTLSKTKLKKIILHEIKSLMGNQSHKLPDFLYAPLEAAIKNSNFWAKPNTEDESDMESVRGEWHNQTPAATDLGWAIEDYLKSSGIPVKVIVISLEEGDSDIDLPVGPDHRLYPNRIVVAGQQGVGSRGQFNMYLFLTPVSNDFRPADVNPEEISRRIGNIVRHELIHAKQFEKRRRSQNISRMVAKDRFEAEGEIVPDETREIHLQSKMEIDAYAHEFAEELLQIYGKDKALNILRGAVPLDSLNISDQFKEYLDKIPGEAAVIRLKKKIYSNIIDLVDRGIYTEAKRKKRRSRKHDEKTYRVGNKKNLYLDRPTSHGGWPEGPSNSPLSNKPVNVQISDWLKDMDLLETIALRVLSESMGYFGAGFANFKKLVDSGVDAESAADESGFKEIDRGYTRKVYEHPSSKEFVLKIAHDGSDRPDARTSNERLTLAKRTNRDEARSGRETAYDVFPKVYPGDSEGSWILSERVMTLSGNDEMSEFFPEANIPNARYMWILLLDMGMKYAKELGDIHASGDWQAEPKEFKEQMEKLRTTSPGRDVAETFLNLWKNPTFREVSEAMAKYNIAPVEIRYDNVGFVMRGGKKQFVILDVSVGLNPDEATY